MLKLKINLTVSFSKFIHFREEIIINVLTKKIPEYVPLFKENLSKQHNFVFVFLKNRCKTNMRLLYFRLKPEILLRIVFISTTTTYMYNTIQVFHGQGVGGSTYPCVSHTPT